MYSPTGGENSHGRPRRAEIRFRIFTCPGSVLMVMPHLLLAGGEASRPAGLFFFCLLTCFLHDTWTAISRGLLLLRVGPRMRWRLSPGHLDLHPSPARSGAAPRCPSVCFYT
ncbi:hypothetical protein FPV67DRAFT_182881 [Lyophyllum atratum]|nr:hypothetical protein FPV67DRAFT_182881 [Lyophyllum atratum]